MAEITRKPFEVAYKTTPRARRIIRGIQFHETLESAGDLRWVREYDPEAVLVSARELSMDEFRAMTGSPL